jgi:NAD+ synthase (glutamine-hydrolysing)
VLDAILEQYIVKRRSAAEIVAQGVDADVVERVINMVNRNEFKRKQLPVGLKVSGVAFGRGRRMPIASRLDDPGAERCR